MCEAISSTRRLVSEQLFISKPPFVSKWVPFFLIFKQSPCMDEKVIINSAQTRPSPPRRCLPATDCGSFFQNYIFSVFYPSAGENRKAVCLLKVWGDVFAKLPSESFKWLLWTFVLWLYHLVELFSVARQVVQCQHVCGHAYQRSAFMRRRKNSG